MKIVINSCFGGFGISDAQGFALELKPQESLYTDEQYKYYWDCWGPEYEWMRTDPRLIASVEAGDLGGRHAKLTVVEIPDNVHWQIHEYDGSESIIWSESEIHWA